MSDPYWTVFSGRARLEKSKILFDANRDRLHHLPRCVGGWRASGSRVRDGDARRSFLSQAEGGDRVQQASRATMLHYARCRYPFPGRVPGSPRWMALRDAMQYAMLALQVAMTGLSGVPGCSNAHVHHLEIVCIKWSEPSAKGLFSFSSVSFGVA